MPQLPKLKNLDRFIKLKMKRKSMNQKEENIQEIKLYTSQIKLYAPQAQSAKEAQYSNPYVDEEGEDIMRSNYMTNEDLL